MTDIEDLVRAAQERRADHAVPAERIRAALSGRIVRARRRRQFGLAGGAVVAAAAATVIAVPALLIDDSTGGGVTPAAPTAASTGAAPATAAPASPVRALGYRPTWLPPGFTERIRHATRGEPGDGFGPTMTRVFKKQASPGDPWGGTELMLHVNTAADAGAPRDTSGRKVDIGGHQGYYTGSDRGDDKSSVNWTIGPRTVLMVTANRLDIAEKDMLRLARSVRPDPGTTTDPVRLRWLPGGWDTAGITVSGPSAAGWRAEVTVHEAGPEPTPSTKEGKTRGAGRGSVTVLVGSVTDAPPGGTTRTVAGRPAREPVRTDESGAGLLYLVVDLGNGRLMTLVGMGGGLTRDDLAKIAEGTEIVPTGLDWLGG